jgi:Phage tail lysozyme
MPDNSLIVLQHLINRGLQPHQAAGLVGRFQQESGRGLNTGAVGDGGMSFGIGQWNGARRQNLNAFAAAQGRSVADPTLQADFALHEMKGSEKFAGDMLARARNVEEAAKAAMHFERPSGYTRGAPEAGHGYANTVNNAVSLAGGASGTSAGPPTDLPAIAGMASPFAGEDDSLGATLGKASVPNVVLAEAAPAVKPQAPAAPTLTDALTQANAPQAPANPVLDETSPLFSIKNIGQARMLKQQPSPGSFQNRLVR